MNIVDEIFCKSVGESPAIIAGNQQISFSQLRRACDFAAGELGNIKGRRIGLHCPNGIDHIVWSLAILRSGGVLIPVAPELSPRERDEQIRITACDMVLCSGGHAWHRETLESKVLNVSGLKPAKALCGLQSEEPSFDQNVLSRLNPALIRFSSGTTGKRKGVILSHESLLARVTASNSHLGLAAGDRVVWILPMAHHFAVSIILYLLHGVTVILENSHLGEHVFRALSVHQGTVIYAAPFHYGLLSSCASAHEVPHLRLAVSTAAGLPLETARAFQNRFGIPLSQGLGIIECGLPLLNDRWPLEKPGSVGRPQKGYEISVRNKDGGILPDESVGELFIRGPGMVDAYLSPWLSQNAILKDGWFKTGDMARRDSDGACFLLGRSQTVINVGGMKCFPEEVERVLNSHPSILESRVYSAPHSIFGNIPVADVVLKNRVSEPPSPSELMAWCKSQLSAYKIPLKISYVSSLPKTANGKIRRQADDLSQPA